MKERVELHCHTTMSSMDGVASPKEVVEFAKKNGMKAVAVTDHGNILAHQELPHYLDKYAIRPPQNLLEAMWLSLILRRLVFLP